METPRPTAGTERYPLCKRSVRESQAAGLSTFVRAEARRGTGESYRLAVARLFDPGIMRAIGKKGR